MHIVLCALPKQESGLMRIDYILVENDDSQLDWTLGFCLIGGLDSLVRENHQLE
jgi:hypothetical protein